MADATYQPKVYMKQGGDEQIIASGGAITVESGGKFHLPLIIAVADVTLTAANSGTTYIVDAVDLTFSLPATVAGLSFTFCVATLSSNTGLLISPVAADAIHGGGLTSTDNQDLKNTAATDAEGDMVSIVGDGVDGWFITSIQGTWAKV